ncbi:4'-phosphopantetheinyl transferase superfamily protein [Streptomyces palmae]|uniref:4'-phosphopantetheinyl transferase superfamily protein n=1 Tax=Streptomyces palmae TaxID=1701085 RepID=A0A4Z0H760_9ACTN|nr:4'-phosphopantetheinyl transferase superfamily protein [Streptomyces palmae]TGB09361.1 4'-phosphopantetheinyl transferase superfamily protein [Streptomyces palmae]
MLSAADRAGAERALRALRRHLAARGLTLGLARAGEPSALPGGPVERRLAEGMVPGRRRDFLAGRCAARRALAGAALPVAEIPYVGRRPRLPAGSVGTISHSGGLAIALAASDRHFRALGCDLELRGLPWAAAHLVLTAGEQEWARGAASPARAERLLLEVFSAKESAFKAYCALPAAGGAPTSLREITTAPAPNGYTARLRDRPGPPLRVRVERAGPGVFSWTAVPAP